VGVADNRQYLRIGLMGVDYLLPGSAGFVIEKREDLEAGEPGGLVAAVRVLPNGTRTPAYSLDGGLDPVARHGWQRAVFVQGNPAAGLVADEIELLSPAEVHVERFRPLGRPVTRAGHLFSSAWVRAGAVPVLMFEPRALLAYLDQLGGAQ
jgi:hypothetical protein